MITASTKMDKPVFLATVFLIIVVGSEAQQTVNANKQVIENFCVTTLQQTVQQTNNCIEKSTTHTIQDGQSALITYLCCLGAFMDTNTNYMLNLDNSLLVSLKDIIDSTEQIPDLGNFVAMCTPDARADNYKLTDKDYLYWLKNGKTVKQCRNLGAQ